MHAVARELHLDDLAAQLHTEILKLDIAHDQVLALLRRCNTAEAAEHIRSSTDASTSVTKVMPTRPCQIMTRDDAVHDCHQ